MRVIGGKYRGSRLETPKNDNIRPTSDRIRESLFNILANHISFEQTQVLDLFSGTGALGIEALSRGAKSCHFVDQNKTSLTLTKKNVAKITPDTPVSFTLSPAVKAISSGRLHDNAPYDLIFMDPPYGHDLTAPILDTLAKNAAPILHSMTYIVIEMSAKKPEAEAPEPFKLIDTRTYGSTTLKIYTLE